MLDVRTIRQDPDRVSLALKDRNSDFDISLVLRLDEEVRKKRAEVESLQAQRNEIARRIAEAKRKGADVSSDVSLGASVAREISAIEGTLVSDEERLRGLLALIPNIPHSSVPVGIDDRANREIKRSGEIRQFTFEPLPHWEIGTKLGILDMDRASRMSGTRFAMLKGLGARLERALVNFMLDLHVKEQGYTEIFPPLMVNDRAMFGTGQLPKFKEDMFKIEGQEMYLIPTAEVPVTNIHREEILLGDAFPIKYAAYTPCFRAEAGSAGRDTRGLIRNHQFNKVELVWFSLPENSYDALESLTCDAETVLERLGLPYRRVVLSTGDLGFSSAKTFDLEVWLPSSNDYREISSCSNFEDFQARRASIRLRRNPKAKPEFVHTLNGSGVAVGRTWAAIVENYQNEDGSVTVPDALVPYMDGVEVIGNQQART
ncbi:MAG: serine--tRNA ligase [Bacillota bacterium]